MKVVREKARARAVVKAVQKGLIAYNRKFIGPARWQNIVLSAREGRRIVGGLTGFIGWNDCYVTMLWVDQASRGEGTGTALIRAAERVARKRRCALVHLNTFSFQAPKFYEKLGYRRFGELKKTPTSRTSRIFYVRRLSGAKA